jgi:nicotinate phosphoribosyltransferase
MLSATGLQTEFYQLVQSALYHADGMWGDATVDLYLRDLPAHHGYMIVAGVHEAIAHVLNLRFSEDDIEWLQSQPMYTNLGSTFFESLRHFRFTGDIWAMPEGTAVFSNEPIMRITAPLPQIGLFEMMVTQSVGCAMAVATNAARITSAAGGRSVLDFGSRRVPGAAMARTAARAAFIGGCAGTTHALAARDSGIPAVGLISDTMLAAYEDVALAYDALSSHFPNGCHLNLPTECPLEAIDRFEHIHDKVQTVRVDHPDLDSISKAIRKRLDEKKMEHTRILGSGRLDALSIRALVDGDAPIDLFAVGSALTEGIAGGGPSLCYRMASLVRGTTPEPITGHWSAHWSGIKQVCRFHNRDVVCAEVEVPENIKMGGVPLLRASVIAGEITSTLPSLQESRDHCDRSVQNLPHGVRQLIAPDIHPVQPSSTIVNWREATR